MNQELKIQERRKISALGKAYVIAASKRVRRSKTNPNIWMVESESSQEKFYRIMYDRDLDDFVCDCKAYEYGMTNPCKHITAIALIETKVSNN